jgi:nucleoside 2-deoxyribosyltransferase
MSGPPWTTDWAFAIAGAIKAVVSKRFPRELGSWPSISNFDLKAYVFTKRGVALLIMLPKQGGVPTVGAIEEGKIEPPILPTDLATALSQQSEILGDLGFDSNSTVMVIPFDTERSPKAKEYFESWQTIEKQSWATQLRANFLRQQQALLGFPRLENAPFAPPGYEHLMEPLASLLKDHPIYEDNVFIMTRFETTPDLSSTLEYVKTLLKSRGLQGLRADSKTYPRDRQLWSNLCTFMLGCSKGIAILEDKVKPDFNPNVGIEYGFMRALNKPVLVLAEKDFQRISADLSGIIRQRFDLKNPVTLKKPIEEWLSEVMAKASDEGETVSLGQ